MFIFNPLTENNIIVSLGYTEIAEPIYLFRFVHKESKTETFCFAEVDQNYSQRRVGFIIQTVASNPDNTVGEIALTYGDEYNAYIYAMPTQSETYANGDLIYQGQMKYNKTIESRNVYIREATERKIYVRE